MAAEPAKAAEDPRAEGLRSKLRALLPGVLIAFTIAAAARFLSEHYGGPAMLFALLVGMAFHFLSTEKPCAEGIQFTASRILRIGVVLLGVSVSFADLASLGFGPALATPVLIGLTVAFGVGISRLMGRSIQFGILSGGAVAICGASAALAISAALPAGGGAKSCEERDTLFTVIAVTTLSTIAMIAYPILFAAFGFQDMEIGYLIGATIHDVAQVVGAGYAVSDETGAIATYVKMLRVVMLPVVVIAIAVAHRNETAEGQAGARSSFPWFAIGFAALLAINSTGVLPDLLVSVLREVSRWCLIAAIAALGMKTSLKAMGELGGGHIAIVVGETLFLLVLAFVAIQLI
ncbi:MAG: putative sulfate exporter family transporter [Pseudomonadota bacterium]